MKTQNYLIDWEPHLLLHKQYLTAFAFRMTGSLAEAEDIVQDTVIECANVNPLDIKNHKSWLTRVCSNKGIDLLRSAYKKRETYPGTWLPDSIPEIFEPLEQNLIMSESATTSFLLLVEKLSPEERVVYLLHEVFEYSFKEIAGVLEKTEDACKKIAQRARTAIDGTKVKYAASSETQKLVSMFFEKAKLGDQDGLMALLSKDSEFWADGGGKVSVLSQEIVKDIEKIAKFFAWLGKSKIFHSDEYRAEIHQINFVPGIVVSKITPSGTWEFETLLSFDSLDGKIVRIYAQRNPDKLKKLLKCLHSV